MSAADPKRPFKFGPGWLLFCGMVALLLFNRNSREVVKVMKERVKVQTQRMSTEYEGLKTALEKKKREER